jgi:hypothetical protein
MGTLSILVKTDESQALLQQLYKGPTSDPQGEALALSGYFKELASGGTRGAVRVQTGAEDPVAASGTLTLTSVPVDATCVIAGVTLTAKASAANENQFVQAGTDAQDAASLASVINAHSVLGLFLIASSATNVVTITSKVPGVIGNTITIVGAASIVASAGTLAGGAGGATDTASVYSLGI